MKSNIHFNRNNHRSHSEWKQDKLPQSMIPIKWLTQNVWGWKGTMTIRVLLQSSLHPQAPTSPENSCGSRAAWTEVNWENICTGRNSSKRRNTENYGLYRAGHLTDTDLCYLSLSSKASKRLNWDANGEGM